MKKLAFIILTVLLVLISAFTLTACSSTTSTDKLLRRNWCENDITETFTYAVTSSADASLTGSLVTSISKYEEGYLMTLTQSMSNGDGFVGKVYFKSSGSSSNYVPSWSEKTSTFSNGTALTQKVVYNGETVDYYEENALALSENATHLSEEISTPYYDNMQFYTILRGAIYDSDFSLAFNTYIPNEHRVVKLTCALNSTATSTFTINGVETSIDSQLIYISLTQANVSQAVSAQYATNDIEINSYKVKHALVKIEEGNLSYSLTNIAIS